MAHVVYNADDNKHIWTPEAVLAMMANPVYVGIYPYPEVVPEDMWVKAAVKSIQEVGAEKFLRTMLQSLRDSMEATAVEDE